MEKYVNSYIAEKMVLSGNYLEFYKYSIPIKVDYKRCSIPRIKTNYEDYERRSDSLFRSRQTVRRLIWSNLTPNSKFLTLTVKDNITDVKVFKRYFQTFLQQMSRYGYKLKYVYVLERQKRGAIHAHLVVFNDEYIPTKILRSAWHYGFVKINVLNGLKNGTEERINDIGTYVCKYITKEAVKEWGSRSYSCSIGLKRSEVLNCKVYGDEDVGYLRDNNDYNLQYVYELLDKAKINYSNSKSIVLDRSTNLPLCQTIDYFQGTVKSEVYQYKFK